MKTNVIKLQFVELGTPQIKAQRKEYTYYCNDDVAVGEIVNVVEGKQGVITQINVPLSEIEPFKDRARTILGKFKADESEEC